MGEGESGRTEKPTRGRDRTRKKSSAASGQVGGAESEADCGRITTTPLKRIKRARRGEMQAEERSFGTATGDCLIA